MINKNWNTAISITHIPDAPLYLQLGISSERINEISNAIIEITKQKPIDVGIFLQLLKGSIALTPPEWIASTYIISLLFSFNENYKP